MKQKILFSFLLLLVLMPFTLAIEGTVSPNTRHNLFANCIDGTYIASSANISIYYPNTSIFIDNQQMTNFSVGQFNYSVLFPSTTGIYQASVTCIKDSDGSLEQRSQTIQVTDLQEEFNMGELVLLFGLIGFISIILFVVLKLDDRKYPEVVFLKILTVLFVLFLTILIPKAGIDAIGEQSQTAQTFFFAVTWYIRVILGLGFIYLIYKIFSGWPILLRAIDKLRRRR